MRDALIAGGFPEALLSIPWWWPGVCAVALTAFLIWINWPPIEARLAGVAPADTLPAPPVALALAAAEPQSPYVEFEFPGRGFGHDSPFRSAMHHRPGTEVWQQYEELWVKLTARRPLRNASTKVIVREDQGTRSREWVVPDAFLGQVSPEQTAEVLVSRRTHGGDGAWLLPLGPNVPARLGGRCRVEVIVYHDEGPSRAEFRLAFSNDWERRPQSEVSRLQGIENKPVMTTSHGGMFLGSSSVFDTAEY